MTSQQAMSDQPASSGFSWTEVVSRGLKLRVPQPASRTTTIDGKRLQYTAHTIYEDPEVSSLLRASQVESIIKAVLKPESVVFSIPSHHFNEQFDAYELILKQIGPVVGDHFQLHSFSRGTKDLVLSTKFRSAEHTQQALDEGITVNDIPYKDKAEANHLVRINLSLSLAEEDDVLVAGLQQSLGHYRRVVQIKKLKRRGYYEGDLAIMLDRNPGEMDQNAYQDLQRMLYLEEWDCFAPASFKGAQPICYYCRKSGHLKKDCESLKALSCFKCGKAGHIRRNCRKPDVEEQPQHKETSFEEEFEAYTQQRDRQQQKEQQMDLAVDLTVDSQVLKDITLDPYGVTDSSQELPEEDLPMTCLLEESNKALATSGALQSKFAPATERLSMDVDKLAMERPLFNQSKTAMKGNNGTSSQIATNIDVPSRHPSSHVARTGHE